jgi:hypothetical protein
MRKIVLSLLCSLLVLMGVELALREVLFKNASYSNSKSIDRQLHDRDARDDWDILFIGDSEVMWGIDPKVLDREFAAAGTPMRSFNHAFEGFGASWWSLLLQPLLQQPSLQHVKSVALGVQLIESQHPITTSGNECGDLQKPVLTSSFAVDMGVDTVCSMQTWDARLGRTLFDRLWIVRYASSVRSLLTSPFLDADKSQLGINSATIGLSVNGFAPHRSIADNRKEYEAESARWKAQYNAKRDFVPLAPDVWLGMVASGGFFDQFNAAVKGSNRQLILFALPTNPTLIDTFNRRSDYRRNSYLLRQWAASRGAIFVDLGIQDVASSDTFFSDIRHLSGTGAEIFSAALGRALAVQLKAP